MGAPTIRETVTDWGELAAPGAAMVTVVVYRPWDNPEAFIVR